MHGIFLHVAADAGGSLAVILSTWLTLWKPWYLWDPLATIIIAVLIFAAAVPLVTSSGQKLLLVIPDQLEYNIKTVPTGARKILYLNWPLILLLTAVASVGFLMLYSVAGGTLGRWAEPQMERFALGMFAMFFVAMVPIWFWRNVSVLAYLFSPKGDTQT